MNTVIKFEKELPRVTGNVFLVTDENVAGYYSHLFDCPHYIMRAGEKNKTLATVEKITTAMLKAGCDRRAVLVAMGGGVVGDTAGFAAAVYMRGIQWVNIPTTLLAQADSGAGGKTGVNLGAYKNMAGAFHAPKEVIICHDFLGTLPKKEYLSGLGEIIKTAMLDRELWEWVYKYRFGNIEKIVKACIEFKQSVVKEDFREEGRRKILNLGHTIGHALETLDNHTLPHGEYVAWGILHETKMFEEDIDPKFLAEVRDLIGEILEGNPDPYNKFDKAAIIDACRKDKKNKGGKITFVVPVKAGAQEIKGITPQGKP